MFCRLAPFLESFSVTRAYELRCWLKPIGKVPNVAVGSGDNFYYCSLFNPPSHASFFALLHPSSFPTLEKNRPGISILRCLCTRVHETTTDRCWRRTARTFEDGESTACHTLSSNRRRLLLAVYASKCNLFHVTCSCWRVFACVCSVCTCVLMWTTGQLFVDHENPNIRECVNWK